MRKSTLLYLLPALLLAACREPIPEVEDPHHVVVDGKPMTGIAFLKRYCQGDLVHPSCVAVSRAVVQDAARAELPKGW